MVYSTAIQITTKKNRQMVDITGQVAKAVSDSEIGDGLALVFTTHTTTGLLINERESGLLNDVEAVLCGLVPPSRTYAHDRVDDNAASHIQSVLLSPSVVVPVEAGRLALGTWQSILLAERDGPRSRSLLVRVIGESA